MTKPWKNISLKMVSPGFVVYWCVSQNGKGHIELATNGLAMEVMTPRLDQGSPSESCWMIPVWEIFERVSNDRY